jgi:hypothetical protein
MLSFPQDVLIVLHWTDCTTIGDNKKNLDCTIRTKQHMHFIHSYIKIVSVWDPTAHFNIYK